MALLVGLAEMERMESKAKEYEHPNSGLFDFVTNIFLLNSLFNNSNIYRVTGTGRLRLEFDIINL